MTASLGSSLSHLKGFGKAQKAALLKLLRTITTKPNINITPTKALIDEPVTINVDGLPRNQRVTLLARLQDAGREFMSCAHYTANSHGNVNTEIHASMGGSFAGVEPMGLFWAMVVSSKHTTPQKLIKRDVTTPYKVTVSVLSEHQDLNNIQATEIPSGLLTSADIERWYMGPGVTRQPVRDGRLRGVVFIPPGTGPFPAILDLYGGVGGLFDYRGALLASRGFITLSLAYLRYDNLPPNLEDLDFQYFQEATDWLQCHPKAQPGGIGIIGFSFGGGMAYLLSVHCKQIRAVVAINGIPFSTLRDQHIKGEHIKGYLPMPVFGDSYSTSTFDFQETDNIEMTPIWRSGTEVLCLIGEDDKSVDPEFHRLWFQKMANKDTRHVQSVFYPRTGHLLEPPYTPLCKVSFVNIWNTRILWGGEPKSHAIAEEDAWKRTLEHFNTYLKRRDE